MTKAFDNFNNWRKRTTDRMYHIMGEECVICGYNKCRDALDLHHINPEEKEFNIGDLRKKSLKWAKIEAELRKCTVLCSNCHRELHSGLHDDKILVSSFSDKRLKEIQKACKYCGKSIENFFNDYCNKSCRAKHFHTKHNVAEAMRLAKSTWAEIDVIELLERNDGVMVRAAKEVNLSDNGVKKRFKKVTGFNNWQEYQQAKLDGMILC